MHPRSFGPPLPRAVLARGVLAMGVLSMGVLAMGVLATGVLGAIAGCVEEPGSRAPTAPEAVVRIAGGANEPVTLARETRLARPAVGPVRVCAPRTGTLPANRLEVGVGVPTPSSSTPEVASWRVTRGGRAADGGTLATGWNDLVLGEDLAPGECVELSLAGAPGARVTDACLHRRGTPRPWVVLYVVDTLRADQVGGQLAGVAIAPAMTRFADASLRFSHAFASSSWTRPTVATLLTGLEANQHGIYGFDDRLPDAVERLPLRLAAAGYATVAISTNPHVLPDWGFLPGFDRFVDVKVRLGPKHNPAFQKLSAAVAHAIAGHADAPLFLYVHDNGPHVPYQADASHRERFGAPPLGHPAERPGQADDAEGLDASRRLYAAAIHATDARFESLLDALRAANRFDDALIVLVGDHGEEFGEHGGLMHGKTVYQELLHVPLLVKPPRSANVAPGVVATAVSTTALAPSVLSLLGLEPPAAMGETLPLRDAEAGEPRVLVSELDLMKSRAQAAVLWPWKLVRTPTRERLYDLSRDPAERIDASAAQPRVVAHLGHALDARRRDSSVGLSIACVAGDEAQTIELTLETDDPDTATPRPLRLEEDDHLQADATRIALTLALRPARPPRSLSPWEMATHRPDIDGVWIPDFSGERVRVRWNEPDSVRLLDPQGVSIAPDDAWIDLTRLRTGSRPHRYGRPTRATCHAAYVAPRTPPAPAEMDEEMESRLRELGYLE